MSDVASVRCENESLRKVRERLLLWDVKDNALAPLTNEQQDAIDILTQAIDNNYYNLTEEEKDTIKSEDDSTENDNKLKEIENLKTIPSESLQELLMKSLKDGDGGCIETTQDFLFLYDKVNNELHDNSMDIYIKFFNELKSRKNECDEILKRTEIGIKNLNYLKSEYEFVSNKTSSLNIASEKLLREQNDLNNLCIEINRRLRYFKQAEQLSQRLQSPTLSVASDNFKECLNEIDTCLDYLMQNRMQEQLTKRSETLGRDVLHTKSSLISRLPAYLTIQFMRFQFKSKEAINAKILKDIKFPIDFDAYELCTPELQQKLLPMRSKFKEIEDAKVEKQHKNKDGPIKKDNTGNDDETNVKYEPYWFEDDFGSNNSGFYTLQAVLTHKGRSCNSGHYVAWVRQKGDVWMKFDDDVVNAVTTEDILRLSGGGDWHCAYVLLYGPKLLEISGQDEEKK